nr:DUF1778 domain-containing protein [Escherichia coli]
MSAVKKQRIDLRLTDDDKSMIEEAAAISNQSVSQFMLNSASQRAAEVIEQHRRVFPEGGSWARGVDTAGKPPAPRGKEKKLGKRTYGK